MPLAIVDCGPDIFRMVYAPVGSAPGLRAAVPPCHAARSPVGTPTPAIRAPRGSAMKALAPVVAAFAKRPPAPIRPTAVIATAAPTAVKATTAPPATVEPAPAAAPAVSAAVLSKRWI